MSKSDAQIFMELARVSIRMRRQVQSDLARRDLSAIADAGRQQGFHFEPDDIVRVVYMAGMKAPETTPRVSV